MPLSDSEAQAIDPAGLSSDQSIRGRAVATVLGKHGDELAVARRRLAESYLQATAPSFHLIPRGDAMVPHTAFGDAYSTLSSATQGFQVVTAETLVAALSDDPRALAPLRMITGLTLKELAVSIRLATSVSTTEPSLRALERGAAPPRPGTAQAQRRGELLQRIADTVIAVVERRILAVPEAVAASFHSKLDKRDTERGWTTVLRDARDGVPYAELLYQRYVGGVWRQVQDAYSEVKGDAILELPLEQILIAERIPYHRSAGGATGAVATSRRYGIEPGPDFLIPEENPAVIIETKVVEDGGSARDKAARIQRLSEIAGARGLVLCAVVDGKGWAERPQALADVVIATQGRTFSLSTLRHVLAVPEVAVWIGRAASDSS